MKNKNLVITLFAIAFISMMSICLASAATLTAPTASGFYKSPLTVTSTYASNGGNNMTNLTCYYNASGGAAKTYLIQVINTTASQTSLTGTSVALSSETSTYNITCVLMNDTTLNTTFFVSGITIDNTNPTQDIKETSVGQTEPINYKCSDTNINTFTVSHANAGGVTVTEDLQKSTTNYIQYLTTVAGTYTFTCTDKSGNSASEAITASVPDGAAIPPKAITPTGLAVQNILNSPYTWVIVLGALALYFANKK